MRVSGGLQGYKSEVGIEGVRLKLYIFYILLFVKLLFSNFEMKIKFYIV